MKNKRLKVVRVTRTEFELSDGRVYEHPAPLGYDPNVADFQKVYDHWKDVLEVYFAEQDDRPTDRAD